MGLRGGVVRPLKTAGDRLSPGAHWRAPGAQPLHWKDRKALQPGGGRLHAFEQQCGICLTRRSVPATHSIGDAARGTRTWLLSA